MKKNTLAILIILLGISSLRAQEQKGLINKGKILSVKIGPGEKHRYTIRLEAAQFAYLQVMQKGADVKVTTFDTGGKVMEEIDSPNGEIGPENVMLHSTGKGNYQLEIEALGTNGPAAGYSLDLKILRPVAVTPAQKIDEIFLPWDNQNSAAASVAVLKAGRLIYQKGYGMANLEQRIPNNPATMFQIASVTKSFTAYAVLLLGKQGKLSLEDDIRKYLPEVPDFGRTITLRHLLQHTSGIRTYESLAAMSGYEILSKASFFKLISRQRDLNFLPGAEYDYSNSGFVLLAEVVARVSGLHYSSFISEHILKPLKMGASVMQDDRSKLISGVADSYEPGAEGPRKLYVVNDLVGSTGLVCTAADLAKWGAFLARPVKDSDIVAKMSAPGKLNDGSITAYGLGLALAEHKGHREIGHSGAIGGFKAHLSVFPKEDLVVVVLANASDIYSRPVARQIADVFLPSVKRAAAPVVPSLVVNANEHGSARVTSFDKSAVKLEEYTGTFYSDELETTYTLRVVNGKLIAAHSFLKDITFTAEDKDAFIMDGWNGRVNFSRNAEGRVSGCAFSFTRMRNLKFRKL